MTRSKYQFYPTEHDGGEGRDLPSHPPFTARPVLAADNALPYGTEQSAEGTAREILARLTAPGARQMAKKLPISLGTFYSILSELVAKTPGVAVLPYRDPPTTVAFCTHNLVFCIGTVLHHTSRFGERVTLSASGGERPTLSLTCEGVAETRERAAARFGLDREGRLPILLSIAENSDFSLTLAGGDEAKLLFHLPRYRAETYRVYALTAHTLRAAFMLPLLRFQNK